MATITDLGFSLDQLNQAVADGDVRMQVHPEFPYLHIFNYTEDVQFRNRWNKITLACRGLILNLDTKEVVARPWEKFFNFGQRDNEIDSTGPVEVTDKMDGSLGILYRRPDGEFAIATRGSFASDQAVHATKLLQERYYDMFTKETGLMGSSHFGTLVREWTFLFEIIYPDNRIVVNYGDMDDLVILGAVHKTYGHYVGPNVAAAMSIWRGPVTESWHYDSFVDAVGFPDRKGKEGVVIRSGSKMVKLKQADYVELHRIVTNLSPKTIWSMLGDGKTVDSICAGIPDEFHKYVEDIGRDLLDQASEITGDAMAHYYKIVQEMPVGWSRRQYAEKAVKSPHKALLFMLLDRQDIKGVVWQNIKPRGDIKTLVKDEG